MIRSTRKQKASVCVLAAHPLVLAQVERILNVLPGRLSVVRAEDQEMPKSSVYVIDAASCLAGVAVQVRELLSKDPTAQILVLGDGFSDEEAFDLLHIGVKGLTHARKDGGAAAACADDSLVWWTLGVAKDARQIRGRDGRTFATARPRDTWQRALESAGATDCFRSLQEPDEQRDCQRIEHFRADREISRF